MKATVNIIFTAILCPIFLWQAWATISKYQAARTSLQVDVREETQGDMLLNLASPAGLPAAFPLDAADFANIPGTGDKMLSKICSAAQALRKILLEICQIADISWYFFQNVVVKK